VSLMIHGYVLMTSGGTPLWFRFFRNMSDDEKEKYELFSSAIAAVFSLINETLGDDVKEVITNNHRLFLVRSGDIILLVVADKKTKAPTDEFSKFVNRIASRIDPEIPIEELFVQSIIDALAEFEIRIEELNTIEKLSHI